MKTIDRTELELWTREDRAFALLDVLPDAPAATHSAEELPHAHSRADFMAQVARLDDRKEDPVVLYEAATATVHSDAAALQLEQAGFTQVYRFIGPQTALHASGHGASSE